MRHESTGCNSGRLFRVTTPQVQVPAGPYAGATDVATEAWWAGYSLRKPSWGFPDYLIAFAAWLVFSLVGAAPLILAGAGTAAYAWILIVTVVFPWIGMGGWPWLIARLRGNGARLDYGLRVGFADIGWGLLYGGAALLVSSVLALITVEIFGEFDSSAGDLASSLEEFPIQRFFFAVAVGLGAPIVEEICYRGLLMSSLLKRNMSAWLAVVLSAALFAVMHFEPVRFLLLFGVGVILGVARVHRRNTTTAIVAHMANNMPGAIAVLFLTG